MMCLRQTQKKDWRAESIRGHVCPTSFGVSEESPEAPQGGSRTGNTSLGNVIFFFLLWLIAYCKAHSLKTELLRRQARVSL